ncbi:TPA: carbon storage regulator [Yersinia enterocolitica]
MLIFSRRVGEAVLFGDEIHMTVIAVDERHGHATIGITAPQAVEVHQQEATQDRKQGVAITYKRRFRPLVPGKVKADNH